MEAKLKNKSGIWVTGNDFFNREREVEKLTRLIDEGNSVLLVAPRRVGKTSLIRETFRRMNSRGNACTFYVDLQNCTYPHEFVEALANSTRSNESVWNRVRSVFQAALDRVESVGIKDMA